MATTEEIVAIYPQFRAFLEHPEIGPILKRATDEGLDAGRLQGLIFETDWYKRTWADKRTLEVLKGTDPAEWENQKNQAVAEVGTLIQQLGVNFSGNPAAFDQLVIGYMENGRDDWWLYDNVGKILTKDHSLINGDGGLAEKVASYREMAANYLLPYDDTTLTKFAVDEWRKYSTPEAVQNQMRDDAIKRYGFLEEPLRRGLSVREVMQPVTNTVAKTLEISPDLVDLNEPRWRKLLEFEGDDGKPRAMTVSEADRWARRQDEFQYTKTARDEAYGVATQILRTMGEV